MLWNDLKSAAAARELIAELGGPAWWAEHTGSVPSASFTVTKLRWLAEHEPGNAARVARVMLPHDWLTWRLAVAGPAGPAAEPVTDRGDASGTGYFSPAASRWLPEVAAAALGHEPGPAADRQARRSGRRDRHRRRAGPRHRRQHGRRARPQPGTRRAGHLDRHLGHRVRGHRAARGRRVRHGGRVRRRHRPVPAADRHGQRGPGAVRGGQADRHRPGRHVGRRRCRPSRARAAWCCCPTWTASAARTGRTPPACCAA